MKNLLNKVFKTIGVLGIVFSMGCTSFEDHAIPPIKIVKGKVSFTELPSQAKITGKVSVFVESIVNQKVYEITSLDKESNSFQMSGDFPHLYKEDTVTLLVAYPAVDIASDINNLKYDLRDQSSLSGLSDPTLRAYVGKSKYVVLGSDEMSFIVEDKVTEVELRFTVPPGLNPSDVDSVRVKSPELAHYAQLNAMAEGAAWSFYLTNQFITIKLDGENKIENGVLVVRMVALPTAAPIKKIDFTLMVNGVANLGFYEDPIGVTFPIGTVATISVNILTAEQVLELKAADMTIEEFTNTKKLRGVIRNDAGNFVAHYDLNNTTDKITWTYFDGRELKHATKNITSYVAYTINCEPIVIGDYTLSGFTYEAESSGNIVLNGTGLTGLQLVTSDGDREDFWTSTTGHYFIKLDRPETGTPTLTKGDLADHLLTEVISQGYMKVIELNSDKGAYELTTMPNNYTGYVNDRTLIGQDIVRFRWTGEYGAGWKDEDADLNKEKLVELLGTYHSDDGVILLKKNSNERQYYMLSPNGAGWFLFEN